MQLPSFARVCSSVCQSIYVLSKYGTKYNISDRMVLFNVYKYQITSISCSWRWPGRKQDLASGMNSLLPWNVAAIDPEWRRPPATWKPLYIRTVCCMVVGWHSNDSAVINYKLVWRVIFYSVSSISLALNGLWDQIHGTHQQFNTQMEIIEISLFQAWSYTLKRPECSEKGHIYLIVISCP